MSSIMARTQLTDGSGRWFNKAKATRWDEGTRWNGNNHISLATGSQWDHEELFRTDSGQFILHSWSQWQGSSEGYEFIDSASAVVWLATNDRDVPDDLEPALRHLENLPCPLDSESDHSGVARTGAPQGQGGATARASHGFTSPHTEIPMPEIDAKAMKAAADKHVFRAGTNAVYDTVFNGLIPCKVIEVTHDCYGFICGQPDSLTIRLTADHGPYRKGEEIKASGYSVVPRKMLRKRKYSTTVCTSYVWRQDDPPELCRSCGHNPCPDWCEGA
jgi:hypothetical protein